MLVRLLKTLLLPARGAGNTERVAAAALSLITCALLRRWRRRLPSVVSGVALARGLEAAGAASRLRHLHLASNGLSDAAARSLGRALAKQGSSGALRLLSLAHNKVGPEGARALAKGLRVNPSLKSLDLTHNRIGSEGAAALAASISGAGGLESGRRRTLLLRR